MPESYRLLEYEKYLAVARDRLSRVARYADETGAESQHVLYWSGRVVQSLLDTEWIATRGPLPIDPTQAESDAAALLVEQQQTQAQTGAVQLRQRVLGTAQSAVGTSIDDLTAGQIKALLVVLLWKNGAINASGVVQPLSEWT